MADLASLGIVVKTQGVAEAEQQLDKLASAGRKAAASSDAMAAATKTSLGDTGMTWRKFVAERMSDYMRLEGGHAGAMKRMGAEWKDYKAGLTGVAAASAQVTPAAQAVVASVARIAPAMGGAANSAKQLQAATYGLPAQFTDIFTSLSSGQAPMQVLIQQGGQLKDMFGGIGPAARAMGGYIAGLVNPYTIAAGAVVALGVAWNQAESEAANFNRALVLTGNQAGLTAADLEAMARTLDSSTNATQGKASAVLAEVAATGQFTAEQIEMVAKAAIQMEEATGRAIGDTVKEFASLKGEPVDAILKLNDAIGDGTNVTRFLTQETLDQIKALKDQGREAEATDVAMRALFGAIDERAPAAVESMTTLQLVVKDLGQGVREIGDAFVGAFRRADDAIDSTIGMLGTAVEALGPLGYAISRVGGAYADSVRARQTESDGISVNVIDPRNPASMNIRPPSRPDGSGIVDGQRERQRIEFERAGLRYLDEQAQKKRDIADVQKLINNGVIAQGEGEKRIAEINADYAERAKKRERKPRGISDRDSGASLLQQIQQQIALTEQEALAGEKLTASDRLRVQMQSLLASEKSKVTAATREALDAGLKELEAAEQYRDVMETNAVIDAEAAAQQNKLAEARQRHADAIASAMDDMRFELELIGKSNIERARMIALREADAMAMGDQRDAYADLAEQMVRAQEAEAVTLDLRYAAKDMFASFIDGSKSAGEAFKDFGKSLQRIAAQILAEKAVQSLMGMFFGGGGQGSGIMAWATGNPLSGGWSSGGYTGPGGKYDPAGVVHKGEVVWSQSDVARAGGVGVVEAMRLGKPGYANGGVAGMYAPAPMAARGGDVTLIVENNGEPMQARTEESQGAGGERLIKLILDRAEDRIAGSVSRMDKVGRAMQSRFNLTPAGVNRG